MSEDFLKNPLSLFDVKGKTAIVTGATGAFGALERNVSGPAAADLDTSRTGATASNGLSKTTVHSDESPPPHL